MRRSLQFAAFNLPMLVCAPVLAASLQISPVFIQLSGDQAGEAINLRNDSDQPIHAQVRTYGWDQAGDADRLTPTRELLASPPIAQVPAGGEQVIRVIRADRAAPATERAYRLIIDELPPENGASGAAVHFRFRYSVPLFVEPAAASQAANLTWSVVEREGASYLRVVNRGDMHARINAVSLRSAAGEVPVAAGLLGYVLAGRTRSWPIPGNAHILQGAAGEVRATVNGAEVKAALVNADGPAP